MRQLKITKQLTDRSDLALNKYLTEVNSLSESITPQEEIELTRLIKQGDLHARNKLCMANLRFVVSVAKQYNGQAPLIDLINEGNIGLIKAAEKFDETRGFKFISYAVWWIRQQIMQSLAENGRKIRLPLNKIGFSNKIKQAMSDLEQRLQRPASPEEISDHLIEMEMNRVNSRGQASGEPSKYSVDKVKEMIESSQGISSIDAPMGNDSDASTMSDIIQGDVTLGADYGMKIEDLKIDIARVLNCLKPRERDIIIYNFGLFDTKQISLEEIGEKFDLTRERVRQIKESALRRMKTYRSKKMLKEYR